MTMTLTPAQTQAEALQHLEDVPQLAEALDAYQRVQLVRASDLGTTQQALARATSRAQSSISEALVRARAALADRPTGHPLWPSEVIELYAAGLLPRDEVLSYLATYPYIESAPTDDPAYTVSQPGEFGEVSAANWNGKFSDADYADLYALMHGDR